MNTRVDENLKDGSAAEFNQAATSPAEDRGNRIAQVDGLPAPHEFPDADVVIYDGQCVFCCGQVRNLRRFDGKNRLAYLSLHDPLARELCPGLTHEDLMKQMYVVSPAKEVFGGAAALRYLSRRLPKLWLVAPFLHIPFSLPLWQWAYSQIAKRRYKIANKGGEACDADGTCKIHFDE